MRYVLMAPADGSGGGAGAAPAGGAPAAPAAGGASAALAAGGAAPAPASGTAPAAPAGGAAPAASDWTSGLDESARSYVTTKGFKNPGEVLNSYQNLEKLHGSPDKLVKLPDSDDADGWNKVYERLGRPAKPEDYKIDVPKEGGDPEMAKQMAALFHKNGLSATQAQELAKGWNEYQANAVKAQQAELQQAIETERATLQKEWGMAHEQNLKIASRAAKEFGLTPEAIDAMEIAMGYDGVMKFFHKIGTQLGEPSFVSGASASDMALTPGQAKERISALRNDNAWVQKYTSGDAGAMREMQRLQQMANPENVMH